MKYFLLQKVRYRLPGRNRLIWAVVLAQRDGLSLLFVKKPDEEWTDMLAVAIENVDERCYEDVKASRFPLERGELLSIGGKLAAIGEGLAESEMAEFFRPEDFF